MDSRPRRVALTAAIVLGAAIGVGAAVLLNDVVLGIAIGAGVAVVTRIINVWSAPKPHVGAPSLPRRWR